LLADSSGVLELALPDHHDPPPSERKGLAQSIISRPVGFELWQPEIKPRFRQSRKSAKGLHVAVPEASVHEDCCAPTTDNDVRLSRQTAQPEGAVTVSAFVTR
jgi:hypothetical protein